MTVRCGAAARVCSPTIVCVQALGLDGAAQLLRQRDAHRVRHPRVQRELELVRPVVVVDRADRARRGDRRRPAGRGRSPRRTRTARAAARARKPASHGWTGTRMRPRGARSPRSCAASSRRGRAGRAVVHDAVGVHRQPVQREVRPQLRRERREPAAQALRRGVQRVAEHERLVGLDERERLGREQAVQVRRAGLDVRCGRSRRSRRTRSSSACGEVPGSSCLADPARELGRSRR